MNLARFLPALLLTTAFLHAAEPQLRWWKGNLHTHTLWSDGDDYPEMVADWYKEHGYHFLALSDHNIMQVGPAWLYLTNGTLAQKALAPYRERFGDAWVERAELRGQPVVRLKTLADFRPKFEEPGRFLLIPSEEITSRFERHPIHLVGTNLREVIGAQHGPDVQTVIQRSVTAVLRQRADTGQPMFPHVAHPNFGWGITAEDLMDVRGEKFFEVYNGHPHGQNEGDAQHPSTERMWDIILTQRLARLGQAVMYGLAVDDAHLYHLMANTNSNPGRGWVMVRAEKLSPEALVWAMEQGDFYATTGVRLSDVHWETNRLSLVIEPEPGVTYSTQFIGTRRGFDPSSKPVQTTNAEMPAITRTYSKDIGVVLAEVPGLTPGYQAKKDDLYIRAKVISSKLKKNFVNPGELESAWVQPQVTALGARVNRAAARAARR